MTKSTYSYLLERLVEITSWQDPDETLPIDKRREIYTQRAALLRHIAELLPPRFAEEILQRAGRLATRIDDDEGWFDHPQVRPLPTQIKEIIRKGLREGRQEDLRQVGILLREILVNIAASGEVTE